MKGILGILNKEDKLPYFLLCPALLFFALFLIFPLVFSFWMSLHSWDFGSPLETMRFVGLENFLSFIHDPFFKNALGVTIKFTVGTIAIELIISMITALIFSQPVKGMNVIRGLAIMPLMVSPAIIGMVFKMLYSSMFGWFNYFLNLVGFQSVSWLSNPKIALWSAIFVEAWRRIPFVTLILLSGLSALPVTPFEVAKVDGANGLQVFYYITLPLLRPFILLSLLIRIMDAFRTFDLIFTLTAGGPGTVTESISLYAYRNAFIEGNFGRGTALSWVILIIIIFISIFLNRMFCKGEYEI